VGPEIRRRSPLYYCLICLAACFAGLSLASASTADEPAVSDPPEAEAAYESFETFVKAWLSQMAEDARGERERNRLSATLSSAGFDAAHSYRDVSGEYKIRLKATGRESAPYVGVVSYVEHLYDCIAAPEESCKQVDSSQITEIFPYKNGNWQY
jgi:hypothetical protein